MLIIRRRKKPKKAEEKALLDVVIDEKVNPVVQANLFEEVTDEKIMREEEIKKYATEKPEQVVDIVKSWLNENER